MNNDKIKCGDCNGSGVVGSPPDQYHPCECTYSGNPRATEAGTPAKAGTPLRWRRCRDTGHIVQDDEGDYVLHEESERHAQARAEDARREGEELYRTMWLEVCGRVEELKVELAAQRTAGGDAVTICEAVLESHRNARFTGTTAIGIKACIDALKAAQPVAEAAAQADGGKRTLEWLDQFTINMRAKGWADDSIAEMIAVMVDTRVLYSQADAPTAQPTPEDPNWMGQIPNRLADLATAQPTPPDDEHPAVRELRNLLADKDVIEVITTKQEESARAALRHPPVPNGGDGAAAPAQHIPGNFTTHCNAWREAITSCRDQAQRIGDREGAAYWGHELAAYDRAFTRLLDKPEPVRPAADQKARIRSSALACGFTIKEGLTDLKPYVYDFAAAMIAIGRGDAVREYIAKGAEPAAAATIDTPELRGMLAGLWLLGNQGGGDTEALKSRIVTRIDAAIAAAREEGHKEGDAAINAMSQIAVLTGVTGGPDEILADLRARLASAGAGEDTARLDFIENSTSDLRANDAPTPGGDDCDVFWTVIEHHMAEPREREIGWGSTARAAIDAARQDSAAADKGEQS